MTASAAASSLASMASLRLVRAQPLRAALLWFAVHAFLAIVMGNVAGLSVKGTLLLAFAAAAVAFFDSRRRRETSFLGNLGVPSYVGPVVAAATIILLEIVAYQVTAAVA